MRRSVILLPIVHFTKRNNVISAVRGNQRLDNRVQSGGFVGQADLAR